MINFKLNESQIMIQSSLEKALDENFDIRKLNMNAEKAEGLNHGWKEIKELGYTGIITGEDTGGFGLDIFDFGLTLGRFILFGPDGLFLAIRVGFKLFWGLLI